MIEVPHPSCAAAARAHVAMLRASGSYRHHLTLLSSHVCSLTRVKRTPSTSETAGGGEALGNAKEGGGEGATPKTASILVSSLWHDACNLRHRPGE